MIIFEREVVLFFIRKQIQMKLFSSNNFYIRLIATIVSLLFTSVVFSQSDQAYIALDAMDFFVQMNLSENEVLIDVRSLKEFKKERIPNAILANNSDKLFSITDTLDIEQPLFIYCEEETRSIAACKYLKSRGFNYVYFLHGGITNWKRKNLEVDNSRIRTKRLEQ
jgi:rhodanese-related sulfurtransferase